MNKNITTIIEGLQLNKISEGVDLQSIDVDSVKPEKKDMDRAEGMKLNNRKAREDGSPWKVCAAKMAKAIKDPMKLIRRSKAVRMTYGDFYDGDSDSDVWEPFEEALKSMGFSPSKIQSIEKCKPANGITRVAKPIQKPKPQPKPQPKPSIQAEKPKQKKEIKAKSEVDYDFPF